MADENPKLEEVRFVYEKARHHRSFHADGAWASITPVGEIQVSFFNDLRPYPQYVVHSVDSISRELGAEVSREISTSITRELNVTVVLNPETLQRVIGLLGTLLAKIEREKTEADKSAQTNEVKAS